MLITLFLIIILILSAVFHEYAHGWMARRLGDDTAERAGRLTLNPLVHLDWIGSVLLPLILLITKANFFLAWAKPVPYNPYNLSDKKYGELKVALAGPMTNFILAIVFGLIARFMPLATGVKTQLSIGFLSGANDAVLALTSGSIVASLTLIALMACAINLMLGIFNLVPVPPLDGSKILAAILPARAREALWRLEQYGFILLIFLIMLGAFGFVFNIVLFLFSLIVGV